MSEDRSTQLMERHAESLQRFDYFVTGLALALVGWLGGRAGPIELSDPADLCYLGALILLLGAAFCGLKRLEATTTVLRMNALALSAEETASMRQQVAQAHGTPVDAHTGAELDREALRKSADDQLRLAQEARELMEQTIKTTETWYQARTWSLLAGLALLVLGRLLEGVWVLTSRPVIGWGLRFAYPQLAPQLP